MKEKILLIIPAFNEAEAIGGVINSIKKYLPQIDILVVNDGSSDKTVQVAKNFQVDLLALPFNMGYGTALQAGYKYARQKGYEYILQMDSDGQHEPSYLKDVLDSLIKNEAQVVIGSRFLQLDSYKPSTLRLTGMKIFALIASVFTHQKITDPTSGFIGFKKEVLAFLTSEDFPIDFPDADAIIMMYRKGFRLKEIPVLMRKSRKKKSMHSGLKPAYYVFKMFLSVFVTLLRKKN